LGEVISGEFSSVELVPEGLILGEDFIGGLAIGEVVLGGLVIREVVLGGLV